MVIHSKSIQVYSSAHLRLVAVSAADDSEFLRSPDAADTHIMRCRATSTAKARYASLVHPRLFLSQDVWDLSFDRSWVRNGNPEYTNIIAYQRMASPHTWQNMPLPGAHCNS